LLMDASAELSPLFAPIVKGSCSNKLTNGKHFVEYL